MLFSHINKIRLLELSYFAMPESEFKENWAAAQIHHMPFERRLKSWIIYNFKWNQRCLSRGSNSLNSTFGFMICNDSANYSVIFLINVIFTDNRHRASLRLNRYYDMKPHFYLRTHFSQQKVRTCNIICNEVDLLLGKKEYRSYLK